MSRKPETDFIQRLHRKMGAVKPYHMKLNNPLASRMSTTAAAVVSCGSSTSTTRRQGWA